MQPNNFDLLRLFAALQVVYSHIYKYLDVSAGALHWFIMSFPGVPIFFVLSGFLISSAWERNSVLTTYMINRALRVLPGLWTCVLMTVLVVTLFGFNPFHAEGLAWIALQFGALIYTPGFLDAFGFGSYNGALWTIPVELQFYVVLPLVYFVFAKRQLNVVFVGLFFIFLCVNVVYRTHAPSLAGVNPEPEALTFKLLRYSFLPHIYLFFFGVLIQRTKLYQHRFIEGKGLLWLAAYVVLIFVTPDIVLFKQLLLCFLGLAAISIAFTKRQLSHNLLGRHDISYGVYIYHGLVINVFVQLQLTGSWVYAVGVVVFTILAGALSWLLVERVCMRFKPSSQYTALGKTG